MKYSLALTFLIVLQAAPVQAKWYRCKHEVLPGESLNIIAKRYHVAVKRISAANRLKSRWIRPGQKLRIRSRHPCRTRSRVKYRVRRGDTFKKLSRRYKVSVRMLRRLNPRIKRRLITGKQIWVVVEGRRPNGGILGMHQLRSGAGYIVRTPRLAWGTYLTVTQLVDVFAAHFNKYPKAHSLRVDDLSRQGGGLLKPHASHRTGRDVDVRYLLIINTRAYVRANAKTLDVPRTWDLMQAFMQTGDLVYIFVDYRLQKLLYEHAVKLKVPEDKLKKYFQYPRARRTALGIIRHEPGHATHMHIRFRRSTPDDEPNS